MVPAWAERPLMATSNQTCAWVPVTAAIFRPSFSRTERGGAAVADGVQRGAHGDAVGVGQGEGFGEGGDAGPDGGADDAAAEAAAFLVGPVDQFDRGGGLDAALVQRAHDLEAGEDAERTVELAAGGLAVEVAADQHGAPGRIGAGAAGEHVADLVDADGEAGGFAVGAEAVAAEAVFGAEGEAADAAVAGVPEFGHFHQQGPQAGAVDLQIRQSHVSRLQRDRPLAGGHTPPG